MKFKIMVHRDYDLRTPLDWKLMDISEYHPITVFVNRRRNIAHVFWRGEVEAWLRLKLPGTQLRGTTDSYLFGWLEKHVGRWL